ncbi:MAG TPA: hypothetical protein VMH35_21295 [Streptosporangiaceae bacterium]|nr:hypothetical protein [Streptosporangiaceae bacterium]
MSERNEMNCREFSDVAAELALGVLTGRERAGALAHLDHCDACRETVRQLTMTGEGLVGLLPAREPPAGFETRVMERIGLAAPAPGPASRASWRHRMTHAGRRPAAPAAAAPAAPGQKWYAGRTRRMLAVAAVVLAVVAGGLGGWGLRGGTSSSASTQLNSGTLLSASHQAVGKIFLYRGSPRWVYMSVDMPAGNGTVVCQVVSAGGHVTTVGSFRLTDGHGYWGSPAPQTPGQLTGARLVSTDGTVLATASFHAA